MSSKNAKGTLHISNLLFIARKTIDSNYLKYGQIYQLNQYFGLYKQLAKDRFFQIIQHLLERRLLEKQNGENYFHITKLGENFIEQHRIRPNYLQGDKYRNIDQLFFQRILLLVQVFTNSKMNHMKFLPIIENRDVEDGKNFLSKVETKK